MDRKDAAIWGDHDLNWAGWLAMTIGMAGFGVVARLVLAVVSGRLSATWA